MYRIRARLEHIGLHEQITSDYNAAHKESKSNQPSLTLEKPLKSLNNPIPKSNKQDTDHLDEIRKVHELNKKGMQTAECNELPIENIPIAALFIKIVSFVVLESHPFHLAEE